MIAGFECSFRKAVAEFVDVTLDDGLAFRRNALEPVCAVFSELFFQGHRRPLFWPTRDDIELGVIGWRCACQAVKAIE